MNADLFSNGKNDYSHIERILPKHLVNPYKKVTIIVTFYKNKIILAKTLTSLMKQSYPKNLCEIIVSCDSLSEEVEQAVELIPFRSIPIKIIKQEDRGFRLSTVRNNAIKMATGEIIVMIDFDILCPPDFLQSHLRWHTYDDSNFITIAERIFIDSTKISIQEINSSFKVVESLKPCNSISNRGNKYDKRLKFFDNIKFYTCPFNFVHGCNLAFPKQLALEIGLFDEDFNGHYGYEDIEFAARMYKKSCYIVYVKEAYVFHQENEVLGLEKRRESINHNLIKLHKKVPEVKQFRMKIGEKTP